MLCHKCYHSGMNKRAILIAAAVLVLGIVASLLWKQPSAYDEKAPSYTIAMAAGEEVASWNFKGAYTGNPELEAKAMADIERLKGLFGEEGRADYSLFVSIANQYDLLGDGKNELVYLEKALAIDPATTGLAWHNAGQLFARLGAYETARMAFEKAVAAQPITQYQRALVDFLSEHFAGDAGIKSGQQAIRQSPGEATD